MRASLTLLSLRLVGVSGRSNPVVGVARWLSNATILITTVVEDLGFTRVHSHDDCF
jgi:hypothetical protein